MNLDAAIGPDCAEAVRLWFRARKSGCRQDGWSEEAAHTEALDVAGWVTNQFYERDGLFYGGEVAVVVEVCVESKSKAKVETQLSWEVG